MAERSIVHYMAIGKYVENAKRLAEVVQVLAKHGFADVLRRLGVYEGAPAKVLQSLHLMNPPGEPETLGKRLRAALTDLGPTFVKIGQILSTRPDIVGVEMSNELEALQDRVEQLTFDDIRAVLEESLGRPIEEVFSSFEETPIAAASLSQVHKAVLTTGEIVAVKVQRPGIRAVIDADLQLLTTIASRLEERLEGTVWADPVGLVAEAERSIHRELNFLIEQRIIEEFHANFSESEEVFVPRAYAVACADKVLTMDFIDGVRIDRIEGFKERNCDPVVVAQRGCEALCLQIFSHRLFHADPHPGNILVTQDNQIAFLDYGMVGRLERADVFAIAELLQSIFERNAEQCTRALLQFTATGDADDHDALVRDIGDFISFEAQTVVASGLVGEAIQRVIGILQRHRLHLAPRIALLLKALATVENTARVLDPYLDMTPIIQPHVERIIEERYSASHLLEDAQHDLIGALRIGRQLPEELAHLVRMLRRGRLRFQIDHYKLAQIAHVFDRASNRITFGLITGALIIGSSTLVSQGSTVRQFGLVGFTVAGVLGVGLLVSILRSKNY